QLSALDKADFRIYDSEACRYLWATRGESAQDTLSWLADRGILAAPGTFYGPRGHSHVRVALTATDERVNAAAERLAEQPPGALLDTGPQPGTASSRRRGR